MQNLIVSFLIGYLYPNITYMYQFIKYKGFSINNITNFNYFKVKNKRLGFYYNIQYLWFIKFIIVIIYLFKKNKEYIIMIKKTKGIYYND